MLTLTIETPSQRIRQALGPGRTAIGTSTFRWTATCCCWAKRPDSSVTAQIRHLFRTSSVRIRAKVLVLCHGEICNIGRRI